jgi:hypothetical protein
MAELRAQSEQGESTQGFGGAGTGLGVDLLGELERLRANLVALAERFEDLRTKHNGHAHGGAVAAPPAAEQSAVAFTLQ